jgi:hypothetical protein
MQLDFVVDVSKQGDEERNAVGCATRLDEGCRREEGRPMGKE